MKASDIQIGDWIRRHWTCTDTGREVVRVFQITEIRKNGDTLYAWGKDGNMGRVDQLEPIPLTPEILEKNGFVRNLFWHYYKRTCGEYIIHVQLGYANKIEFIKIIEGGKNDVVPSEKTMLYLPHISYIHELQHALRLCGIEKEIEL